MKTILRRMERNAEEYFCVIDHTLEEFKLSVLRPWEMSDEGDRMSYHIDKGVQIPAYVSTMVINDSTEELLNTKYTIKDKDNLFALIAEALKVITPLELIKRYPNCTWVFDRESLYLKSKDTKYSILEPFAHWCGGDKMHYESSDNLEVFNLLLSQTARGNKEPYLVGVNINEYSYSVFRTAWYDTIIYLEHAIMHMMVLNQVAMTAASWEGIDVSSKLLPKFIERTKSDIAIDLLFSKLNRKVSHAKDLPQIYNIIDEFDNRVLARFYKSLVGHLTFITATQLDWAKFEKLYSEYLNHYVVAILSYMRWNFIRSYVDIPSAFNEPLEIKTPIGRLTMRGGEPVWDI